MNLFKKFEILLAVAVFTVAMTYNPNPAFAQTAGTEDNCEDLKDNDGDDDVDCDDSDCDTDVFCVELEKVEAEAANKRAKVYVKKATAKKKADEAKANADQARFKAAVVAIQTLCTKHEVPTTDCKVADWEDLNKTVTKLVAIVFKKNLKARQQYAVDNGDVSGMPGFSDYDDVVLKWLPKLGGRAIKKSGTIKFSYVAPTSDPKVKARQQAMIAAGCLPTGEDDGIMGSKTRKAEACMATKASAAVTRAPTTKKAKGLVVSGSISGCIAQADRAFKGCTGTGYELKQGAIVTPACLPKIKTYLSSRCK